MVEAKFNNNIIPLEIDTIISNFIITTIEEYVPYIWVVEKKLIKDNDVGKFERNYCNNVQQMTYNSLKNLKNSLGKNLDSACYDSTLDELLSKIYTKSYVFNDDTQWLTYKDIVQEKLDNWNNHKSNNLNDIFYNFFVNNSIDIYYIKIKKEIIKKQKNNIYQKNI